LRDRLPISARDEYLFPRRNWENYEDLLDPLGEVNGPPISDNEVELQVLTRISTGENQLVFEGFYLDGCVPLGGGFDASSRRAAWIFIIGKSRQLAESSLLFKAKCGLTTRWSRPGQHTAVAF
jgi:hypothetical protein